MKKQQKKDALPRWKYDFSCRHCANITEINDPAKHREGDYCKACIDREDAGKPSPIHADDDRHVRCDCYAPLDCNYCEHISLREREQDNKKAPHICRKYGVRVLHNATRLNHNPQLHPCAACLEERRKHENWID